MKKENSIDIKTQVTWNTFGNFVLLFAQWGISVLLVRIADFSEAGVFSLAMTIANVFAYIGNYSTRNFMTSDAGEEYTLRQYVIARVVTICISFILCIAFLSICHYDIKTFAAVIIYLVYANQTSFSDVLYGCMQRKRHLEIGGKACVLKGVLCFTAFLVVYLNRGGLLFSLLAMAIAAFLVMFLYEMPYYRVIVGESACERTQMHGKEICRIISLIKRCFPLMVSMVVPTITVAIPRIVIESLLGEAKLGIYSSIYTPTVVITTLVPSIITGVIPIYAKAWGQRDKSQFVHLSTLSCICVLALGALACLAACVCGKLVMVLLFGEEIIPYFNLLYFAIAATILCALTNCGTAFLTVQRRLSHTLFSAVAALLVSGISSVLLIQKHELYGASWALSLSYMVQFAWQLIVWKVSLSKDMK